MMKRSDLQHKKEYVPPRLKQSPTSNKTWASARNPSNSLKSPKKRYNSNKIAVTTNDDNDYDNDYIFDQSEKDIQLNLHNRLLKSSSETKIIDLIKLQGRKLKLSEIETIAFIKYFKRNGKLDEGLEFLNDYAGYLDKCTKYIIEYTNLTHDFLIQLMNLETRIENNFKYVITQMIRLTTNILHTICLLRKYQKTPKPLIGYTDLNTQSIDSSWYNNTKSIITIIKEISIAIMNNISGNIWKDFSCEELLMLLAPGIEEEDIEKIIMKVHTKRMTMSQAQLAMSIINIIRIEDKIESVWIAFQSLSRYHLLEQDIDNGYFDPYESFPLLRINYDNFIAPTTDHDWFVHTSTKYQIFLDLDLGSMLNSPSKFNIDVIKNEYSPFNESMIPIENPRLQRSFSDFNSRTLISKSMTPMSPITPSRMGTPIVFYDNGSILSNSNNFNRHSRSDMDFSRLDPSSIVSGESTYYNSTSGTPYININSIEREQDNNRKTSPYKKVTMKSPNDNDNTRPQSANPKSPPSRKLSSTGSNKKQDSQKASLKNGNSPKSIRKGAQDRTLKSGSPQISLKNENIIEENKQGNFSNENEITTVTTPAKSPTSHQPYIQKVSLQAIAKQIVHNGLIRWLYRSRRRKIIEKQKIASLVASNFMNPSKIALVVNIQRKIRQLLKRDESGLTIYRRRLMRHNAIHLIQRCIRKFLACLYVYRYISASIVIKRIWIKFRSDRILRQNLRRVNVPLTLTLHELKNIPTRLVRFPEIKVKISIWDHYLLHIVRDMDVQTVLQRKDPRIEFMTPLFSAKQTLDEDQNLENKNSIESTSIKINSTSNNTSDTTTNNNSNNNSTFFRALSSKTSLQSLKEIIEAEELDDSDSDDESESENENEKDNDDKIDNKFQHRRSIMQRVLSTRLPRLESFTSKSNSVINPNSLSYVTFGDFKLKIPGCHGNSVIKFGFYEGSRQFASCVFNLAKYNRLMFWGDVYTSEVNVVGMRRHAKIQGVDTSIADKKFDPSTNYNSKSVRPVAIKEHMKEDENCKFNFTIKAGTPMKSRAGYMQIKIKGKGKVKKAFMSKYLYKSLFKSGWVSLYVSMDHDGLYFYDNRVSLVESFCALSSDFDSIRSERIFKEYGVKKSESGKTEAFLQDTHAIIIKTLDGDEILIRFNSKQVRIQWMERLSLVLASVLEERSKNKKEEKQVFFKRLTRMMSFTANIRRKTKI